MSVSSKSLVDTVFKYMTIPELNSWRAWMRKVKLNHELKQIEQADREEVCGTIIRREDEEEEEEEITDKEERERERERKGKGKESNRQGNAIERLERSREGEN